MRRLSPTGAGIRAAAAALLLTAVVAAGPARGAGCDVEFKLVDFGRLDFRRGGDITGRVEVACAEPAEFTVELTPGFGDYGERRMRGPGGAELRYNLYVDPGRRLVWGDGASGGTAVLRGRNDGRRPTTLPVYGRVPGGQRVPPGSYGDNLAVRLNF